MPGSSSLHLPSSLLLLLMTVCPSVSGQTLEDLAEIALFRDETTEIPIQIFEKMETLKQEPIDLNGATRDQLYESGLFTPFQVEVLLKYRERYGPLYSIYELAGLSGFRRTKLEEIGSCMTAGSPLVKASRNDKKGWTLMEMSSSLPHSGSYPGGDSLKPQLRYPGNPLRIKGRVRAEPSRYLVVGAAFEKDPGERFFTPKGPEFLTGFISYQGSRHLKNLVAGSFRIQHGLGLVNGSGLFHTLRSFSLQPLSVPALSPSVSLAESRYEQGLACQLVTEKIRCLCWSSIASMDLSLQQFVPARGTVDWEQKERTSGMHRTTTELEGRSLAFRSHHGALISWRKQHIRLEAMAGVRINGLTRAGKDSLGLDPGTSVYPIGSIYGGWYGDRLQLVAELAGTAAGDIAVQMVAGYRFSDFLSGLLLLHHYGSGYRGMYPSTYGAGSKIQNERGVAWAWHLEANRLVVADLFIELFRFPSPGLKASVPSQSYRFGGELRNAGSRSQRWIVRAWRKGWQQTGHVEVSGTPTLEWSDVTRLDLQYRRMAGDNFRWDSRLIISWYNRSTGQNPGYATAQQLTWSPFPYLRTTIQLVLFRVTEWDNRIYLHEPGLYHSFQFPVCYGQGEKISAVMVLKAGPHLTISWKMATLVKQAETSSGSQGQSGSWKRKWDLALQVRLHF